MGSKNDITSLKGSLPSFFDGCSAMALAEENPAFARYLALYEFESLQAYYEGFQFGEIDSGGYKIAVSSWQCEGAKTDVLLAHGLFDHLGLYVPLVRHLLSNNFNVVAFDLPEHGISSGEFGHVSSFHSYAGALRDVVKGLALGDKRPLAAVGQSTGAAVIMASLLQAQREAQAHKFSKLILLAPLLRVRAWKRISFTYQCLHRFVDSVPRGFSLNSHDEEFCEFLARVDPLQPKIISVPWVKAMLDWSKEFEHLAVSDIDGLIVQGSEDRTVNGPYNVAKIGEKFPALSFFEIAGAYHHLIRESEPWQAQVFEAITQTLMSDG